ncbi:MAG: M20/M25/M40 family metallo-hydrolase [Lachnospiraceae bacterium]|jgi:carboxypeptidase PM20D1|nr:M20/M25/M40 family metallo-hydrolase [Lachnospiraceae bacterium]MCI1727125.1 M20/M25/M40 family metallo-hydrolase [Lachnospiraceae bacterium]
MGMILLWALAAVLACFLAVILIRAALFVPEPVPAAAEEPVPVNEEKIIADMQDAIRCRTVSNRDESLVDRKEFARFEALLEERFPLFHQKAVKEKVGKTGLLYFLKGKSSEKPSVCMAHYDVVPVNQEEWSVPAFDAVLKDGCIWGRGTLDTKGTLIPSLEAIEQLLKDGFVPENDLYFSFSGEEEIDGASCSDIVSRLEELHVRPAFVLDEGGAIVSGAFPGMKEDCAAVGIVEKGSVNLDFTIEAPGGHASTPPRKSNLGILAGAITRIEKHPFRGQLTEPVRQMFNQLGRHSSFGLKVIFANLWCFWPLLEKICRKSGGDLFALTHTTIAITRAEGSKAYNVMPSKASFGVNLRLLGTDTIESTTAALHRIIGDDRIKSSLVDGSNPSGISDISCEEYGKLKSVIERTWPGTVVAPYQMLACSDSRHYCRITDHVYRFCGQKLSKEERGMIHGVDERIPVETLVKTVVFYIRMIREL